VNEPKRIDLTEKQMAALLSRAKRLLSEEDYEIIKGMADTITFLSRSESKNKAHIQKLVNMLFGEINEKTAKVLKEKKQKDLKDKETKSHGRNGASVYSGAEKIEIPHEGLKPKDKCSVCNKGRVYDTKEPNVIVRITGQAPLSAKVYEMQRLKYNLCGQIFTAQSPEGIGDEKYDSASGAMIALLKYGSGLPFNRLEALQESLNVPLPASIQWEIVEHVADKIAPVYRELIKIAAQGDVLHNDDTVMKILDRMNLSDEDRKGRKGMFTSGFLSIVGSIIIALFLPAITMPVRIWQISLQKEVMNSALPYRCAMN
jgi:transposase